MIPAEFFVSVFDMLELQTAMTEAYKNKAKDADTYNKATKDYNEVRKKVYDECHRRDPKTQKTLYELAKEKIARKACLERLKNELGAEPEY